MSDGKRIEKLRELLDARGIQWYASSNNHNLTQWDVDGLNYSAASLWPRNDETRTKMIVHVSGLTPEQAVSLSPERTCHNTEVGAYCGYFTCSLCGVSCSVEWGGDGWDTPDYCLHCGAKVLHNVTVPKLAGSITLENLQQSVSEPVENLHTARIEMCHGDHPPYPLFKGDAWTVWFICSDCKGAVNLNDKYCKHCGVKLEPYERMESGE